jgi:prepilin-type N-terminal cleavage/methylation domain-containing protein
MRRAFSLIEVVIAVGVVSVGVVVTLGLLAGMSRQSADADDLQTATQMTGAITAELAGLARQPGFDALVTSIPVMAAGADQGLLFVAARDGTDLRLLAAGEGAGREHYFLIEVRRFPAGPLSYTPGAAVLPLSVRVSWPYRAGGPGALPAAVPFGERQQFNFSLAVGR